MFKEELQKIQGHLKEAVGQGEQSGQTDNDDQTEIYQKPQDVDYDSVINLLEDLSGLTYECLAQFEIIDDINERIPRIGEKCKALTETLAHTRDMISKLERVVLGVLVRNLDRCWQD